MLRILPVVTAMFATTTLWSQIAPVGINTGETVRLSVSARPPNSCAAQLGFLDSGGNRIGPSAQVSLQAGQSTSLDVPASAVIKAMGQPVQVQPQMVPDPSTAGSACQANVVVLDKDGKPMRVPGEGVQVNGRWAIDVRNPDGTLAIHRQSSNSNGLPGGGALALSLARLNVIGLWSIQLSGSACSSGGSGSCHLFENADNPPPGLMDAYKGLAVTMPTTGPNAGDLVLAGSFIAPQSGMITGIITGINFCSPGIVQTGCQFNGPNTLSSESTFSLTSQSVSVTVNQLIQVTVVFGFS